MANYQWAFEAKGTASVNAMSKALTALESRLKAVSGAAKTFGAGFKNIGAAFDGAAGRARRTADAFAGIGRTNATFPPSFLPENPCDVWRSRVKNKNRINHTGRFF